jgi:hypothetical protein
MQWWKSQDDGDQGEKTLNESPVTIVHAEDDDEQDKRDRPQLYSDQASINRSLLDP